MTLAKKVLMVRPRSFRSNEETAGNNAFQIKEFGKSSEVLNEAIKEFDGFVQALKGFNIDVVIHAEPEGADTPDALFPNNWFCILPDQTGYIFPMQAQNRQREVHPEWILPLTQGDEINDLRYLGHLGKILEGTGSLILDHSHKMGFACISERTNQDAITVFSESSGYKITSFKAVDAHGMPFYHTNVMMALGIGTAVVCAESILDLKERQKVLSLIKEGGREVVEISQEQVLKFAGNMLQLQNKSGARFWICSKTAEQSLTDDQRKRLERDGQIISVAIPTIERYGGGSARCMMGEIF